MYKIIRPVLTKGKNRRLLLLSASTCYCLLLLLFRLYRTDVLLHWNGSLPELIHKRGYTFLFLAWNLFLAWIPYLLAQYLDRWKDSPKWRLPAALTIGLWLLFFRMHHISSPTCSTSSHAPRSHFGTI